MPEKKVKQRMGVFLHILWTKLLRPSGKELIENVCQGDSPLKGTGLTLCLFLVFLIVVRSAE